MKYKILFLLLMTVLLAGCNSDKWHSVGTPDEPVFKNNWHNTDGGRALRFTKDGNLVFLQGVVVGGGNGALIFNLPEGYRPSRFLEIASGALGELPATITIGLDGSVCTWYSPNARAILLSVAFTTK
jgi:hypothetical protein